MPLPEIEIVDRALKAWNARDYDALAACCSPDVEAHSALARTEGPGVYRGRDGAREWLRNNVDTLDLIVEPEQALVFRGFVLYLFSARTRGSGSGVELRQEYGGVYEIDEGLIRRFFSFTERSEAVTTFAELTAKAGNG